MPSKLGRLHKATMIMDTFLLAVLTDLVGIKRCVQWPHATSPCNGFWVKVEGEWHTTL